MDGLPFLFSPYSNRQAFWIATMIGMDLNPYAAPQEPDGLLTAPAPAPRPAPGGRLRKWGVRIGAVSLLAFFSVIGLALVAGLLGMRGPTREFMIGMATLIILSGICGILSLLLIGAGVAAELLSPARQI
jgi:hypothetical protein